MTEKTNRTTREQYIVPEVEWYAIGADILCASGDGNIEDVGFPTLPW